jgi:hypothetical protein
VRDLGDARQLDGSRLLNKHAAANVWTSMLRNGRGRLEGGCMVLALAGVLIATLAASPAAVKGKWSGTLTAQRDDGTKREDTALLILDQKDTTITGSVGGGEDDQHPITSGTIDGNKIVIVAVTPNGRELRLDLAVENDEMKGTITSGERKGQVLLKKLKQ